jgi:HD-GYP domain-containing protein (c-di-GMP phosphodiesterase class II)
VRILSVIDVYDTLRSDRAYRGAFGHSDAVDILRQEVDRGWWQEEVVALLDTLTAPDKDFVPV